MVAVDAPNGDTSAQAHLRSVHNEIDVEFGPAAITPVLIADRRDKVSACATAALGNICIATPQLATIEHRCVQLARLERRALRSLLEACRARKRFAFAASRESLEKLPIRLSD